METPKLSNKYLRIFYFWAGIIATFCYRAIVVVNNYSHFWAQTFWYIGTIGFIVYFIHRYQISEKRAKIIKEYDLESKIQQSKDLTEKDKVAVEYIFETLRSSKEKWNSIFIFAASFVGLALGIYLDFFKK